MGVGWALVTVIGVGRAPSDPVLPPLGLACDSILIYGQGFEVHPIINPTEQMRNRLCR